MSEPQDGAPAQQPSPQPEAAPPGAVQVTMRRAPRFGPFTITGAVVGALIGVVVAILAPGGASDTDARTILQYFGAIGLLLGGVAGAGLAVLADRRR